MTVRFPCPICQRTLKAKSRAVGAHVTCPACQESIRIPDGTQAEVLLAMRNAERAQQNQSEDNYGEFVIYNDEYLDIETGKVSRPVDTTETPHITLPRSLIYIQAGLLAVMLLAGFVLGGLFGYSFGKSSQVTQQQACLVSSLIYIPNEGPQQADVGATVIVLPIEVWPDEKINPKALQPNQPPPSDDHPDVMAIRELGGSFARCDANGHCELYLPQSGEYFVLFLSGNMERSKNSPEPEDIAQLGRYFLLPTELLGKNQYSWSNRNIEGKHQLKVEFHNQGTTIR